MSRIESTALALPDVDRGVACAGTALECRTFLVTGKAFLFVSKEHLRLKLGRSVADARKRGAIVGTGGWTKLSLDELPPRTILEHWIAESYELLRISSPRKAPARRTRR